MNGFSNLATHITTLFSWRTTCAGLFLFLGVPLLVAVQSTSQCLRRRPSIRPSPDGEESAGKPESERKDGQTTKQSPASSGSSASVSMITANDAPFDVVRTDDTQLSPSNRRNNGQDDCVVAAVLVVEEPPDREPSPVADSTPSWIRRRREARKRRDMESIKRAQARAYMRQRQQHDENTLFEVENARMPEVDLTAQFYAKLKANQADERLDSL